MGVGLGEGGAGGVDSLNVSGEGRDAFKSLEGRAVLYFQVQVLAHFLGEVTGEMRTRQNMSLPGPHPTNRDQLHTSPR